MALLRHLAIRCGSLENSRKFYTEALGWKLVDYRPSGDALDLTDGTLNITLIQQPESWAAHRPPDGNENLHFGVIVGDVKACWKRMSDWGAEFATDSIKSGAKVDPTIPPDVSFKVFDPDGNVIDITGDNQEWVGVDVS